MRDGVGRDRRAHRGAKLTHADFANMAGMRPGEPDGRDFARTDALLEELEGGGLSLDAIILKTPPPAGTFGAFCERLAARYGTRIDYYEIGNEWG